MSYIGDAVQYFGFDKLVLVQTKKEMHTIVNCRIDPKQLDQQGAATYTVAFETSI
jgi:hypothetical protein